jgi:hypothetical protein
MNRPTLALPEPIWTELNAWLDSESEVAGVLTARLIDDDEGTTLLGRNLTAAEPSTYLEQKADHLRLRSSAWVPAVRAAASDDAVAIFVHTHPHGAARFSTRDDRVDVVLGEPFQRLTGYDIYGALVMGEGGGVACRVVRGGDPAEDVRVRVVGDALRIHLPTQHDASVAEVHDRQVRALGSQGQEVLGSLHVGVVGAGGTGSPVIEQLTRLGVGTITIIDDDVVTSSTVARGYGSSMSDVGRLKVDVAADHVARIGLGTRVHPVPANLRSRTAIWSLRHCDVVFCCVDGHSARVILNRWAYWHLAPVIDIGVLVMCNSGLIESIVGRITWISPGAACLLCRQRIDPRAAHLEQLDPRERRQLAAQGYAPALDEPDPSVITYTSLVASTATTELLNRLFGLADSAPTEVLVQVTDRSVSLNRRTPREGCFCGNPMSWGAGIVEPYLDLTWLA